MDGHPLELPSVYPVHQGHLSFLLFRLTFHGSVKTHTERHMHRGAAEKIGGFMETATAKPESEPPDPPEESRCKVIPFEKVG